MRGEAVDEIDAVLQTVRGRTRRDRLAAIRVNRKAECFRCRFVLAGVVDELVML
jgi:hypothetical protein